MIICVFSFNRGRFLQHCVESLERCAPNWRLCVFDDNSEDPETLEILAQIGQKHRVINSVELAGRKHGGLYGNMQKALEYCADEDLMLCLQDDMQLVRRLRPEDEQLLHDYFRKHPGKAFLQPCFLKGANRERDQQSMAFDAGAGVYYGEHQGQSAGVHYSDIMVCQPQRLIKHGWQFRNSEALNDRNACQLFGKMGFLFAPFATWLPEVPAYRGKRKTLALQIAERRRQCGLYPFEYLPPEQESQLLERPASTLPFAEDFLTNVNPELERPWAYHPLRGSRWLKKLNSLELSLRRLTRL